MPELVNKGKEPNKETQALIDQWAYDIAGRLRKRLENLKENLLSDDTSNTRRASEEASEILEWLGPPMEAMGDRARLDRISELIDDDSLSENELRSAIRNVVQAPRRGRGRPYSDTAQHAIYAYALHLKTDLTWMEIAKQVKGCLHRGSTANRSCPECADALRDAVGRLEKFLLRIVAHPVVERQKNPTSKVKCPTTKRKKLSPYTWR